MCYTININRLNKNKNAKKKKKKKELNLHWIFEEHLLICNFIALLLEHSLRLIEYESQLFDDFKVPVIKFKNCSNWCDGVLNGVYKPFKGHFSFKASS